MLLTNNLVIAVHPSNQEMLACDVVQLVHCYTINSNRYTNVISVKTNKVQRYVWKVEELKRGDSVKDLPPMPTLK